MKTKSGWDEDINLSAEMDLYQGAKMGQKGQKKGQKTNQKINKHEHRKIKKP